MEINDLIEELRGYGVYIPVGKQNYADTLDKLANLLEAQQKRIEELEGRWISGKKPPKRWKDEIGDAINYLAIIPGVGVDIVNWIEPTRCWFCMGVPCKVTYWMPLPEPPKEATHG